MPITLLAALAIGCGGIVVVDDRGASSENASSTGVGGAFAGTGSSSGGSAAGGTGGAGAPADCSAPKLTVLAENQVRPVDIAIDASNIYWVNFGGIDSGPSSAHVFALPKSGGTPAEIAVTEGEPYHLFVDDTHVYWDVVASEPPLTGHGILYGVPKAGGPVTKIFVGPTNLYSVTMDEARFYWENGEGKIMSLPKSGGTPTLVVEGAESGYLYKITVDEEHLYWRTPSPALLMSTPKSGGASKLLTGQLEVGDVAVDAMRLFLNRYVSFPGDIFIVPKGGGGPAKLIHEPRGSYRLKQHGACLYWIVAPHLYPDNEEIHAAPKAGGEPVVIFQAGWAEDDYQFAVDASGVYSASQNFGVIMKATK